MSERIVSSQSGTIAIFISSEDENIICTDKGGKKYCMLYLESAPMYITVCVHLFDVVPPAVCASQNSTCSFTGRTVIHWSLFIISLCLCPLFSFFLFFFPVIFSCLSTIRKDFMVLVLQSLLTGNV